MEVRIELQQLWNQKENSINIYLFLISLIQKEILKKLAEVFLFMDNILNIKREVKNKRNMCVLKLSLIFMNASACWSYFSNYLPYIL